MADTKPTKRQLQAIKTKKRIIKSAKRLFNTKDFDQVSVAQISKEASITVGTFYHYFASKEELLYELLPRVTSYLDSDWAKKAADGSAFFQVITFFEWFYQYPYVDHRDIIKHIIASANVVRLLDADRLNILEQLIRQGQEKGEFTLKYNSLYIAKVIWHSNRGIFHHCMLEPDDIDYKAAGYEAVSRIAYTFLTEKGITACPDVSFNN